MKSHLFHVIPIMWVSKKVIQPKKKKVWIKTSRIHISPSETFTVVDP